MQQIKLNKMKIHWITTTTWGDYEVEYTFKCNGN
jgi:hypothetical protein